MGTRKVLKVLSLDFMETFLERFLENAGKDLSEVERVVRQNDCRVFCNIWFTELFDKLASNLKDFKLKSLQQQTCWLLDHFHKICENPMNDIIRSRKELEIVHDLKFYPPRITLMATLEHEDTEKQHDTLDKYTNNHTELQCCNIENYVRFFRLLLELEDLEDLREYVPLVQYGVYIRTMDDKSFSFVLNTSTPKNIESVVVPNMDEVVVVPNNSKFDSTKKNCIMRLVPFNDEECYLPRAMVKKIGNGIVTFEFKIEKPFLRERNPVDIIFRPARQPMRYQNRALDMLLNRWDLRRYLHPKLSQAELHREPKIFRVKLVNEALAKNPEQLQAVANIVTGPNPRMPFIIFGPPGTGKTTLIVESILQLRFQKPHTRILVAAGSNAACDIIAERLCQWEKNPYYQEQLSKTMAYPMLRIFSKEILRRGTENLADDLAYRSNIEWDIGEHAYPAVKDIQKYGIVVTTLCTVGKLVSADVSINNYFTHVFIDEAGASSEPETLVGIMGIKNSVGDGSCCVVLSGDHKQLGPVIKSKAANKCGLGNSLMERLLKTECYATDRTGQYNHNIQARLRRNYRSHPEIVELYNHLFYDDELIAMYNEKKVDNPSWSFLPNPRYPIAFQVVNGEVSKAGTTSTSNLLEIDALIVFVQLLLKDPKVKKEEIGIITPYSLQSSLIKKRLNEENLREVEVGCVEKFQGREKLIILASMVRSDLNLGFVRCPRRLNVLLSRAISLLIILGDPSTLKHSKYLKYFINKCKEKGNYLDEISKISNLQRKCWTPSEIGKSPYRIPPKILNSSSDSDF